MSNPPPEIAVVAATLRTAAEWRGGVTEWTFAYEQQLRFSPLV